MPSVRPKKPSKPAAADRKERQAAALRSNLQRRKQHGRDGAAAPPRTTVIKPRA